MSAQAGPALQRVVHAMRMHGPPALRKAQNVLAMLVSRGHALAQGTLRRAVERWQLGRAEPDQSAAPRPSRAARRAWTAQLEELGRTEVEDLLYRTSSPLAGPEELVRFVDAGITQGSTRYPTRQFVLDWLGGDETPVDLGLWRVSAIVVTTFALLSFGMLAIFV